MEQYLVYFMNGDRPLYWLGGCRFTPTSRGALKFESITQAGEAAEADPAYPICNGIVIGKVSQHT